MKRRQAGIIPLEETRSEASERDFRLTIASLSAQLAGIKAYAEDLEIENRQLRLDNADLRRRLIER